MTVPAGVDPVLWQQAVDAGARGAFRRDYAPSGTAWAEEHDPEQWHRQIAAAALAEAWPVLQQATRAAIADELRQKIKEWRPTVSPSYIRGMNAAVLFVTGEAHQPFVGQQVARGETP